MKIAPEKKTEESINNEMFTIIVRGDSYYERRIRSQSHAIIKDEMHDVVGLFGNYGGDIVHNEEKINDAMERIQYEAEDPSFKRGDSQIEDNLIFYEKVSVIDLVDAMCDNEDEKESLLDTLNIK